MSWQYTDGSRRVVVRVNADGSMESHLVTEPGVAADIAAGNTPADPPPPPATAVEPLSFRTWIERLPAGRQLTIIDGVFATGGIVRVWLCKAMGSITIDVTNPETAAGLGAALQANLITQHEFDILIAP